MTKHFSKLLRVLVPGQWYHVQDSPFTQVPKEFDGRYMGATDTATFETIEGKAIKFNAHDLDEAMAEGETTIFEIDEPTPEDEESDQKPETLPDVYAEELSSVLREEGVHAPREAIQVTQREGRIEYRVELAIARVAYDGKRYVVHTYELIIQNEIDLIWLRSKLHDALIVMEYLNANHNPQE